MATDTTLAPLGSIENPIKFQGQDYKTLCMEFLKSGKLFCDPTFPAEEKSIDKPDLDPKVKQEIEWLRPKEIKENAVFVDETFGTTDVCQGKLSDCWVMASLSCLTLHPYMFAKVVPPNQSLSKSYAGIFHFKFWQYGEWVEVVVDDRLPVRQGRLLFWGNTEEALEDFTGGIAYSKDVSSHTPQDLWRRLKGALSRGGLLSCCIFATNDLEKSKVEEAGLIMNHAYPIVDCDKVTKAFLLLKVRNPWGSCEYCGPWSDSSEDWDDVDKAERDRVKLKIAEEGEFWAPGSTAGGSYKDTYYQNPQFKLVLKEQDQTEDEDKTRKCTVVVELQLKNTRKNKSDIPSIAFDIYKVPPDFQGVCLDSDFFKQNKPIEPLYISRTIRNVVCKLRLDPGNYIIVAFTEDPNQPGEFLVRTFSKRGNTLGSHDFTCTSGYLPVMVTPISSEDQMRIQKTFDEVAGPDDKLNAKELMNLVNSVLNKEYHLTLETCKQLIFGEDTKGRSRLDREQAETLLSSLRSLQSIFCQFDKDSSGTMSPFELSAVLDAVGMQCDIKVVRLLSERFAYGALQLPFHCFVSCFTRLRKLFALYEAETSQEVKDRGINAWLLQFMSL
uniref:calpain-1 catalytic subunit-like n=1 Tax=Monopterus albus TaxID=43700 RepID=UPI0009B3BB7F|nr:calpain-1 catalytic subunit-like [Monopterus albus]